MQSQGVRVDVLLDEHDRRSALYEATSRSLSQSPKEVPAIWLYDERGSQLFDRITQLPEYYPTRRERDVLAACSAEIARRTRAQTLVELGAGTSDKTRLLLDALAAEGHLERFVSVDVSEEVLRASAHAIAGEYPHIAVHAIVGDFERHLEQVPGGDWRLIAFLGSTIGNLDRDRRSGLFVEIADTLLPGDAFLLGIDLVKDAGRLEAAYNDSEGVTEAFVRNGLDALNRELGADFDQSRLAFSARWDPGNEWMDIGFVAREPHIVTIPALDMGLALGTGEPLRFEISTKFRRASLESELLDAGLRLDAWWADADDDFAVLLASRADTPPA